MRLSPRQIVATAGALLWLASMLIQTGTGGIVALWTQGVFLIALLILTSATRTISARSLMPLFFLGGALLGVAILAGKALEIVARDSVWSTVGIPAIEEVLKIAPILVLLWLGRNEETLAFGASDVMLMAAVTGSGFALVEDAFIRHRGAWSESLSWLPVTQIEGGRHGTHLIAGHPVWAALAGCTLGIALLYRTRFSWLVGISGFSWSLLDHIANNYRNSYHNATATLLTVVTADGWLTVYLFVIGVIAVIGLDAYVAYATMPSRPEFAIPRGPWTMDGIRDLSRFLRARRAYAYAAFRARRASEAARGRYDEVAGGIDRVLAGWPRAVASGAVLLVAVAGALAAVAFGVSGVRSGWGNVGFAGIAGAIGAGIAAAAGWVGRAMGSIPGPIGAAHRAVDGEIGRIGRSAGNAMGQGGGVDDAIAAGVKTAVSDGVYDAISYGETQVQVGAEVVRDGVTGAAKVEGAIQDGMRSGFERYGAEHEGKPPPPDPAGGSEPSGGH